MTYRYVTDQNIVTPETWHFLPSTSSLVSITHILYELLLQSAQIFHALQWSHNGRNGVSNHQPHDCLLKRLFRHTWNKHQSSSSLAFVTGEFPAQRASNAKNASILWRHHGNNVSLWLLQISYRGTGLMSLQCSIFTQCAPFAWQGMV